MEPTIDELRRWSAEFMGWTWDEQPLRIKKGGVCDGDFYSPSCYRDASGRAIHYAGSWRPDRPETGQIWMVVERMREKGLELALKVYEEHFIAVFQPAGAKWSWNGYWIDTNPCLAILKAAHAAERSSRNDK